MTFRTQNTHKDIAAYIAQCEASVTKNKKQTLESVQRQRAFEATIANRINEIVNAVNAPLMELIRDIKRSIK